MDDFQRWLSVHALDRPTMKDSGSRWVEEKSSTTSLSSIQSDGNDNSPSLNNSDPTADLTTPPSIATHEQYTHCHINVSRDLNRNSAAADEVRGDEPAIATLLGHGTDGYMGGGSTRRREVIIDKIVASRKPLPPTPAQSFDNDPKSETLGSDSQFFGPSKTLQANASSVETVTSPPASQRSSIRQTGLQLPVSTFTPASRPLNVQENGLNAFSERNHNESQPPLIVTQATVPGLEIAHNPLAGSQAIVQIDGEPHRFIRATQLAESSEVHMLDTAAWRRSSGDSASILSRKKRHLFSFRSRSEKPSPIILPASLELGFSSCGSNLVIWCSKDATQIIRIRHPFRSGQRYTLDLPQSTDGKAPNTSIRYLCSSGEIIVALVHIENVSRLILKKTVTLISC